MLYQLESPLQSQITPNQEPFKSCIPHPGSPQNQDNFQARTAGSCSISISTQKVLLKKLYPTYPTGKTALKQAITWRQILYTTLTSEVVQKERIVFTLDFSIIHYNGLSTASE